ncbi:MAG TPA: phosphomannose isomerase type II C-terminal cupin domain [Micavibrio sp.]
MNKSAPESVPYKVGDSDQRPWGHYIVTAVGLNDQGEEYCEKDITVKPAQILSLQSHKLRREHWTVKTGVLTVIVDGRRMTLSAGEDVRIPEGGIHCMANLAAEDCVVHEMQEGTCREEDIIRYLDAYRRAPDDHDGAAAADSVALYRDILSQLGL